MCVFVLLSSLSQTLEAAMLSIATTVSTDCLLQKEELPIAALSAAEVPPALVIGAAADPIVDRQDCEALAASLHTEQLLWLEGGHDVMLDVCWPQVSAAVADFARGIAA